MRNDDPPLTGEQLKALFAEWTADEAAAQREGAREPGKGTLQTLFEVTTEDAVVRAGQDQRFEPREMNDEEKLRGFRACLADLQNNGVYYEEPDGSWQRWPELSPEGKLHYIARDATLYDIPFEPFAEAARDLLPPADLADAALRVTLSHQMELHQLAELLPDDRGTESTPLVDRLKEVLRDHPDRAGADRSHDGGIER